MIGKNVSHYRIIDKLGGGLGDVYKACNTRLERTVAIKVLPPEIREQPEREAQFEREARTISQLAHLHICTFETSPG